jgi:hypothetical protein
MNPHAMALAMRGLRVFPLARGEKFPAESGWQAAATADPIDAGEQIPDGANVGVSTDGLFVLDVDSGKGGLDALEQLRVLGNIPATFTVRSARGGLHLYFRPRDGERFRSRAYRKMPDGRELFAINGFPGVDVRADGGLTVGPGSTFDGRPYEIETDAEIAELPEFIAERARAAAPQIVPSAATATGPVDEPGTIHRATVYLMSAAPAVEGSGGDPHTIAVANRVMDFGISPETCAQLMLEHWNDRCSPPWDADRLLYKCQSAAKSRQEPIGRANHDDAFPTLEPVAYEGAPIPSKLLRFPEEISIPALIAAQENDIVKNLLAPGDFSVLYGPSGAGKSFVALWLAYHVAQGKPWLGRRVNRAAVLYICAEAERAFQKRVQLAEQIYGSAGGWFAWLAVPAWLARGQQGDESVRQIVAAAKELKEATGAENVIVVFDTLAQVMAGEDENSVEAMMFFVKGRAGVISRAVNAHAMVVHHTGKSKDGSMRGSSALFGASDAVLKLDARDGAKTLIAQKVKDGPEGPLCGFSLAPQILAYDSDGEPVSSCYVAVGTNPALQKCASAALEIISAAIVTDVVLSSRPRAQNYAAKYCYDNQGNLPYSEAEYASALLALLAGPLAAEKYDNKGREAWRIVFRDNSKIDLPDVN